MNTRRPRFRWLRALLFSAAMGCVARCALSQTFELSAGASTIYGAAGGTLLIHGEQTETSFGAGIANHRFGAGGAVQRTTAGGTTTVGMQQVRADVPTDIFAQTHVLVGLGAGYSRGKSSTGQQWRSFAGFASVNGGSPLFTTGDIEAPMLFSQVQVPLPHACRSVTTAIDFRQFLALESVGCELEGKGIWRLAGTAGGGSAGFYGASSAAFESTRLHFQAAYIKAGENVDRSTVTYGSIPEPDGLNLSVDYQVAKDWDVSAMHEHFVIAPFTDKASPDLNTPRENTSLDEIAIAFHHGHTGVSASAISSVLQLPEGEAPAGNPLLSLGLLNSSNTSLAAGFEQDFGPVRWTENFVESQSSVESRQTLSISSLALRLNPHILGSLSADVSNGHLSLAPGGEWTTASTHVRVDYELLYFANRSQTPFQQALEINAGMRIWHALGVEVASEVGPTGAMGYTFRFTTFGAHSGPASAAGLRTQVGDSVLLGSVVDERGFPVAGAALSVDNSPIFTDMNGMFCFRERHPALHTLHVSLDEFLTPGHFLVTSAPDRVSSQRESEARPVRIALARQAIPVAPVTARSNEPTVAAAVAGDRGEYP